MCAIIIIYRSLVTFCVAKKKHILVSFQNDILPLSNSVPEAVGKADQLKDEGKYLLQKLLSASLETATLSW